MSKRKPLLALFLFISLLFGCTESPTDPVDFVLLTSEKTLPENFEEIAYKEDTGRVLLRKADEQSAFDEYWRLFELDAPKPNVDFNEQVVFFIGIIESGSCALEIEHVGLNEENTKMEIPLTFESEELKKQKTVACTADATPRTFVIQLEKQITEKITHVLIDGATVPVE